MPSASRPAVASPPAATVFLVSCEHGGKRIPAPFRHLFTGQGTLLASHRGYDPGSLAMARTLAAALGAPLIFATVSRLLIDLNRSLHHQQVFSLLSRRASAGEQLAIINHHYLPYRTRLEHWIRHACSSGQRVVHLSSHSFTPTLNGHHREADIGLLFDPKRAGEVRLCRAWQAQLALQAPTLRVRRNYPYAGAADGMPRHLRQRFGDGAYIGIELEINQALVVRGGPEWPALRNTVAGALVRACSEAFHPAPIPQETPDAASRRLRHAVQSSAGHTDDPQPEHPLLARLGRDRP